LFLLFWLSFPKGIRFMGSGNQAKRITKVQNQGPDEPNQNRRRYTHNRRQKRNSTRTNGIAMRRKLSRDI
jgi:hypothetical protein